MTTPVSPKSRINDRPSLLEHRIYLRGIKNHFIHIDDLLDISGNRKTIRTLLGRLVRKGHLIRVRQGFYAAIPLEHLNTDFQVDPIILADRFMDSQGALAFHTALELQGAAYSFFNTTFYLVRQSRRPIEFQESTIRFVSTSVLFGMRNTERDGVIIRVTDRERTVLDCIRRPDCCGGLEELIKSLDHFTSLDIAKLDEYLDRFGERSLFQRTGFILDYLKDRMRVPREYMNDLKSKVGSRVYYLTPDMKPGNSKLDKTWNVFVPRNIDEVARFV